MAPPKLWFSGACLHGLRNEMCFPLSLLLAQYYAVKIPYVPTTVGTIVLHAAKEILGDDCYFGTCFYPFRGHKFQTMAEACRLCTGRSFAQLRDQALLGFPLQGWWMLATFFHEHWVRSMCSEHLSGLEIMILAHQFSKAENKLLLWLWVSHSRGKWKQESETVFVYWYCVYLCSRPKGGSAVHWWNPWKCWQDPESSTG